MSRPSMRFVPVKTPEAQAALMLAGMRDRLVRRRTQLTNAIRGYAAELGLIAAKGLDKASRQRMQPAPVWDPRRGNHLGQRPTAAAPNRPDI